VSPHTVGDNEQIDAAVDRVRILVALALLSDVCGSVRSYHVSIISKFQRLQAEKAATTRTKTRMSQKFEDKSFVTLVVLRAFVVAAKRD
jgi:hypothetical protein